MEKHLKKDKVIGALIEKFGLLEALSPQKDIFQDILASIVGQQLSTKAADTIWSRFILLFGGKPLTPAKLLSIDDEKIRKCGISYSKINYMKGLAQAVVARELVLENLTKLADEEVIAELTKIKGIGRWTAEMIMIFTLGREDVFSIGDLGLRTSVAALYKVNRDDLSKITEISKKWSPYRSYVSRYLWKSLDNKKN